MRKQVEESTAAESARRATEAAAERDRRGRFSARRKCATVLRLLRGEDLESVSRELGITAARASQWRDPFLAGGQAGLTSRAPDARDEEHQRLHAKVGELLMENELLYAKVDHLKAGGPYGSAEIDARSGAQSISARRAYGVQRVCRVWRRARSSVYVRRHATRSVPPGTRCCDRPHPPSTRSLTVSWRRVPESVGGSTGLVLLPPRGARALRRLKRFSNRPCTTWGGRGTAARTDAGGPMRASSMDLRERALLDSDAGMTAADVAAKYRVSGSWVRLLKQRRRETGEVAPRVQRHGRRGMLEPHLHTVADLIAAHPDRTLAELKDALATPASVPTVWRAVRALGLTVKKTGPPVRTRSA